MGALVDVLWAGRRWVFEDVEIDVRGALSLEDNGFRGRRVTLAVQLGDAALLVSRGHHPRTATVRIEVDGELVLAGPVRSMVPGRVGELTEIVIEELVNPQASKIPGQLDVTSRVVDVDATRADREEWAAQVKWQRDVDNNFALGQGPPLLEQFRIDEDRVPTIWSETVTGRLYPIVIGKPGRNGKPAGPAFPVSVSDSILMVAGHRTTTGTVTIWGPKAGSSSKVVSESFTTSISTDSRGQEITIVDVSAAVTLASDWVIADLDAPDRPWYVAWDGTAEGLSGNPVDVIALLLAHVQGVTVDWASFESLRAELAPYLLDTVIASEASAWDLLTQQVLPLLPVGLVVNANGLGLVPMRLEATAADARMNIVEGPDFAALGRPKYVSETGTLTNQWSVSYGPSRLSNGFGRSVSAAQELPAVARSMSIHGVVSGSLQTAWVYDLATADRVAVDLVLRHGVDRRTIDFAADTEQYGIAGRTPLRLGMVVTLTHADEYVDEVPALVWEIRYQGTRTDMVTLLLLED